MNVIGIQLSGNTIALPHALGTLWGYLSTKPDLFQHLNFGGFFVHHNESVLSILDDIVVEPDIILVTLYMWNRIRTNKLTKALKERYPNAVFAIGGNDVPKAHDRFGRFAHENPQYNYYCWEEGEIAFEHIIRDILFKKGLVDQPANLDLITYVEDGDVKHMYSTKEYMTHKDELDWPTPSSLGVYDEIVAKYKDERTLMGTLETNRGCPYSCTFCDWGLQEKLRRFSLRRVKEEIDWLVDNVDEVHVSDANYGILKRDQDIIEYFIERRNKSLHTRLHSFNVTYAKNLKKPAMVIAKLLEDNGLTRLGASFSLQSMNLKTLSAIKRTNMKITHEYDQSVRMFNEYNVPYYNDIILGLPEETIGSFIEGLDILTKNDPLDIIIHKLHLLENSELNGDSDIERFGLKTENMIMTPSLYEDEVERVNIIRSTNTMSEEDMIVANDARDAIQILWLGKTVMYIGRYLQNEFGVGIASFLVNFMKEKRASQSEYWINFFDTLKNINGVVWYDRSVNETSRINRNVNAWVYIHGDQARRERFYNEFYFYVSDLFDIDEEILDDLFEFQEAFVTPEKIYNKFTTEYNWVKYLQQGKLKKESTEYEVGIDIVGRSKKHVREYSLPERRFFLAGGHDYMMLKLNSHVYSLGLANGVPFTRNFQSTEVPTYEHVRATLDDLKTID